MVRLVRDVAFFDDSHFSRSQGALTMSRIIILRIAIISAPMGGLFSRSCQRYDKLLSTDTLLQHLQRLLEASEPFTDDLDFWTDLVAPIL